MFDALAGNDNGVADASTVRTAPPSVAEQKSRPARLLVVSMRGHSSRREMV